MNFNIRTIYTDVLRKNRVVSSIETINKIIPWHANWWQDCSIVVKLWGRPSHPLMTLIILNAPFMNV